MAQQSSTEDKVIIFDTTLRDGEQSAGAGLTVEEKLRIAHQLNKLGVDVIARPGGRCRYRRGGQGAGGCRQRTYSRVHLRFRHSLDAPDAEEPRGGHGYGRKWS